MDPDQIQVDVLDEEVSRMDPAEGNYAQRVRDLSKLCGSLGCLPRSYVLRDELVLSGEYPHSYGGFSDVWKAQYGDGWAAVKVLRVYAGDQLVMKKAFCHEVTYWKRLDHPHIVRFLGTSSKFYLSIVSEWMANGDLLSYLALHPETERLKLIVQVASAMGYMHSSQLVHGDIKGRNVLINSRGQACLSDFGLAVAVYRTQSLDAIRSVTGPSASPGTIRWSAPERLMPTDDPRHTMPSMASDVYSFGIMMWEVYTLQVPFDNLRQEWLVIPQIVQGLRPARSDQIPGGLWPLMEECWTHERVERPSSAIVSARLRTELGPELPASYSQDQELRGTSDLQDSKAELPSQLVTSTSNRNSSPALEISEQLVTSTPDRKSSPALETPSRTLPSISLPMSSTAPHSAPPNRASMGTTVSNWFSRSGSTVKSAILGGPTTLFLDIIAPRDVLFVGCGARDTETGKLSKNGHFTKKVQPQHLVSWGQECLAKRDSTEWTVALGGLFNILAHLQCPVCRDTYAQALSGSLLIERNGRKLMDQVNGSAFQRYLAVIYFTVLACLSPRFKEFFNSCNIATILENMKKNIQNSSKPDTDLLSLIEAAITLFPRNSFQELSALRKMMTTEQRLLSPTEFVGSLSWIVHSECPTASALEVLVLIPPNEVWDKYNGIVDDPPSRTVERIWDYAALSTSPLARVVFRYLLLQLYEMSYWKRQHHVDSWRFDTSWKTLWIPLLYARAKYQLHKWYAYGALVREAPQIRAILSPTLQIELDALYRDAGVTSGHRWWSLLVKTPARLEDRLVTWLELVLAELDPQVVAATQ